MYECLNLSNSSTLIFFSSQSEREVERNFDVEKMNKVFKEGERFYL
jgi:hypothetical protein